jgi:hypothetical protein
MGYDGENLYLGIREKMPQKIGECAYCHDEVRTDERAFTCGSVLVHKECMLEYIVDTYDVDELAKALLFERVRHEG